jgi:hypothetical protein
MTIDRRVGAALLLALPALTACSVTSKPQNTVLGEAQQQLGKRRIYTSALPPTPQDAVQNFISEGSGAVPVVLIKGEKLYVQHVYDIQASFDTCMSLMSDRVAKTPVERDGGGRRAYYCVPLDNGRPGAPTLVSEADG